MPPAPAAGTGASAKTKNIYFVPSWVTWMYRLAAYNYLSGKLAWVKKTNWNRIGTSPHKFRVLLHQNNSLKLVFIWPVRVLIENWLDGVNKLCNHRRNGTNAGSKLQEHCVNYRMGQ